MPTSEDRKPDFHNLFTREIRPIRNWLEFLERWQAAATLEEMLGLLHAGFSVSLERYQYGEKEYDSIDRVIFYLTIADGWADDDLLEMPEDGQKSYKYGRDRNGYVLNRRPRELRQVVALKAFDMLCLDFFRVEIVKYSGRGERFNDVWVQVIASDRLFPVVLNFFRIEKGQFNDKTRIRNLFPYGLKERPHNEQFARNFLLNLARFIWGWREGELPYYSREDTEAFNNRNIQMRARLDAAKPWMVEVLTKLEGGFELLREWMLEFDEPCLVKLKEIALRRELSVYRDPVTKDRKVATLDEACYVGSRAAWLLRMRELKVSVSKRLAAIREAERSREQAERKIKELTPQSRRPDSESAE